MAAFMVAMEMIYFLERQPPAPGWPRMIALEILASIAVGFFGAGVTWLGEILRSAEKSN
jgi:hypothetical protein